MTDDMIRSMKSQMTPSDDVVNDLLAKIAALEASPENMENVVSFDESRFSRPAEIRTERPAQKAKTTKKSIWFYGTAAAASALVLLSTFAMFGTDSDVQDQFGDIVDNPGIVIDGTQAGENTPDQVSLPPVESDDPDNQDGDNTPAPAKSGEDDKQPGKQDSTDKDSTPDDKQTPDKSDNSDNTMDNSEKTDGDDNSGSKDSEGNGDQSSLVTPPPAGDEDPQSGTVEADDSKVTPGAPGESAISWQREILAESTVSNITISGTNYVVESVASSPSVASTTEVQKISLEIPATSTTNHTTVEAKVKEVKNVSKDLMIAVDAEGFKETLLYTNVDYKPSTLGQYISDAGLGSGKTAFANAVTSQRKAVGKIDTKRINVENIDELVKQYILSSTDAASASYSDYESGKVHVLFRSSKNPTQAVINFGVSDNGYLYVKLTSGNSFTFHIGEEQAQSFINHITGA